MDLGLKGRRALVLGATRGLGRAIAEALAAEGATVAITGRKQADADAVAAAIAKASGAIVTGHALDLMQQGAAEDLARALEGSFGGIDILVGNSGGPPPGTPTALDLDTWRTQFDAMVVSLIGLTNAVLPGMRARKWGRVLITTSSGAVSPIPALVISNTLRAGLHAWAKTLALEVARDGVTVNVILPGRIHTERVDELDDFSAKRAGTTRDEIAKASAASIPMGRYGRVAEYGAVAAFLVSAPAGYMTGTVTRVDGGMINAIEN